jgi:DNA replication and repair protein RecF
VELARTAVPLVAARAAAAQALAGPFAASASALGLEGEVALFYRPRTDDLGETEIVAELTARRAGDIARGFTGWGPHRDEIDLSRDGRSLRRYGSQGQQRIALLSLLFAEREALQAARRQLPLMLLDDVMSELDPERRGRLVELLDSGGQALITATESVHVPDGEAHRRMLVDDGRVTA